jgi:hypothetical protein
MKPLDRWRTMPRDAQIGCGSAAAIVLWFGVSVYAGPDLLVWAPFCLLIPVMVVTLVVLAAGLIFRPNRRRRVVAFLMVLMVSACLVMQWRSPLSDVDLHLILRVYLAGGPDRINDWAQSLIRERTDKPETDSIVDSANIPSGIRMYLPGYTTVGGTIWSDTVRLRIELGGGFYHYGLVVYPTRISPPAERWQSILGWPAEVAIYQEE